MTNTAPVMDNDLRLSGLARKLVTGALLTEDQARQAQEDASKKHISFVAQLVESKTLDAYNIAETGATEFGVPLFDITAMDMDALAVKIVTQTSVLTLVQAWQSSLRGDRRSHRPASPG